MSSPFDVVYYLRTALDSGDVEALLRHCVDNLGCSRSAPDGSNSELFGFSTPKTRRVSGTEITLEEAIQSLADQREGTIMLWYDELFSGIHISKQTEVGLPTISLLLDESYAKPHQDRDPSLVYELIYKMYDYLKPVYVCGDTHLDVSSLTREGILEGRLEDIFWVNGFGPEMVETIGRDQLVEAPAWRVEECDDGGFFVWIAPLPFSKTRPEQGETLREYFEFK